MNCYNLLESTTLAKPQTRRLCRASSSDPEVQMAVLTNIPCNISGRQGPALSRWVDTLYALGDNITHYKTESVNFWGRLNSATKCFITEPYSSTSKCWPQHLVSIVCLAGAGGCRRTD